MTKLIVCFLPSRRESLTWILMSNHLLNNYHFSLLKNFCLCSSCLSLFVLVCVLMLKYICLSFFFFFLKWGSFENSRKKILTLQFWRPYFFVLRLPVSTSRSPVAFWFLLFCVYPVFCFGGAVWYLVSVPSIMKFHNSVAMESLHLLC